MSSLRPHFYWGVESFIEPEFTDIRPLPPNYCATLPFCKWTKLTGTDQVQSLSSLLCDPEPSRRSSTHLRIYLHSRSSCIFPGLKFNYWTTGRTQACTNPRDTGHKQPLWVWPPDAYRMSMSSTFSSTEVLFCPSKHCLNQKHTFIWPLQGAEHQKQAWVL